MMAKATGAWLIDLDLSATPATPALGSTGPTQLGCSWMFDHNGRPATGRVIVDHVIEASVQAMQHEGIPELAIRSFALHLGRLIEGESGLLSRSQIEAVSNLPDSRECASYGDIGLTSLSRVAVIKLNGGLGTSMGLERAKSLLPVRDDLTFLDLIARQVLALRRQAEAPVPLIFMNSFRTDTDTSELLSNYPELESEGLPLGFLQHKAPKIVAENFEPAASPADPELAWCPPGHGDIYTALQTSGILETLLDRKIDYAFISNADNLGAVFEPGILGFMIDHGVDFVMEVADRTAADRKGGHLCRLENGRLALRESAQCPESENEEFQDVDRYRYFNTNNIWVHLSSLKALIADNDGVLPLATIVNRKTLDPRDPDSSLVIQLETAMGSAISLFPKAAAVRVSRQRFSPVKTTNDLLGVRSDAYEMTTDARVRLHPQRSQPPTIDLDPGFFKKIDDFEARFPGGPPSLRACQSLVVVGDVLFESGVSIEGSVSIHASNGQQRLESGSAVTGHVDLG